MESSVTQTLLVIAIPALAVLCLALNLFIRARGRRSFNLYLKGMGIEIKIESSMPKGTRRPSDAEELS